MAEKKGFSRGLENHYWRLTGLVRTNILDCIYCIY